MYWLFLRRGQVKKYDRPYLRLDFWELKEILAWQMSFFPLTRIILLTLGFIWSLYPKYFQSYALLKLLEDICVFASITCCLILLFVVKLGWFGILL